MMNGCLPEERREKTKHQRPNVRLRAVAPFLPRLCAMQELVLQEAAARHACSSGNCCPLPRVFVWREIVVECVFVRHGAQMVQRCAVWKVVAHAHALPTVTAWINLRLILSHARVAPRLGVQRAELSCAAPRTAICPRICGAICE